MASPLWRISQGQRTISSMITKKEIFNVIAISVMVALLTTVPYVLADFLAKPDGVFSGFLMNPFDGFSYLAKMRQGYEGQWLFHLPYTVDPGQGAFIFIFYLFLGHLAKWFGTPLIVMYHAIRFLGAVIMFIVSFFLVARFLREKSHRWWAFGFILLGGGLGWLVLPFEIFASDLWIVESIPFLSAYTNAHFPVAIALFLILILLLLREFRSIQIGLGLAFIISTLLAAVQPFALLVLFAFLFLWLLWETWIETKSPGHGQNRIREKWLIYIAMILGALPWLIYDYWITRSHPQIAEWNAQNITPSPPILVYVFGLGLMLLVAVFGLLTGQFRKSHKERLLMVWIVTQSILLYAPFALQRRLSLGIYFPLIILAVLTMDRVVRESKKLPFIFLLLLILSIPSNLVVVGSGIAGIVKQDPFVFLENDEMKTYQWLASNLDPGEIILASPLTGNRIPAFTSLKVLYGHPFETPHAEEQSSFVEELYSSEDPPDEVVSGLQDMSISYVFYGTQEKSLGQPQWLDNLVEIFNAGEYSVYEIPSP
jgi:MFS family permease